MVSVEFNLISLGDSEFWRLFRWCSERGATDFTVTTLGRYVDYSAELALWQQVRAALEEYEICEVERRIPEDCTWETRNVQVWELSPGSIEVLSSLRVGTRVPAAPRAGFESRPAGMPAPWVAVHHLCIYRDGKPMLALFEEQGEWVMVVVRRGELKAFRDEGFGPETAFYDNYFSDYYG